MQMQMRARHDARTRSGSSVLGARSSSYSNPRTLGAHTGARGDDRGAREHETPAPTSSAACCGRVCTIRRGGDIRSPKLDNKQLRGLPAVHAPFDVLEGAGVEPPEIDLFANQWACPPRAQEWRRALAELRLERIPLRQLCSRPKALHDGGVMRGLESCLANNER